MELDDLDFTQGEDDEARLEEAREKERQFLALLEGMSDEQLSRMLLNKALKSLLVTLEGGFATAADINAARQFLKDNNVGIVATRSNAAGNLEALLKQRSAQAGMAPGVIPVDQLDEVDIGDFVGKEMH